MHAHETNCSSWGMPIDVCIKDLILLQHVYEPKILYNYNMSLQIMKGPNKQIEPEKKHISWTKNLISVFRKLNLEVLCSNI